MLTKLKSKLLTKLFTDWLKDEYDLELIQMTKQMVDDREQYLYEILSAINKIEVEGFSRR